MWLSINGERREISDGTDLAALLGALQLVGKKVAVERNGEIVPRSCHGATRLTEGDELEIVVAVGGG